MTSAPSDRYRRWFEYRQDASCNVLASLVAVPTQQRLSSSLQEANHGFVHSVAALRLWLFGDAISGTHPPGLCSRRVALISLESPTREIPTTRTAGLDRLDETELTRVFDYRSFEGPLFRHCVEDILTQLFGNSCYRCGQKAASDLSHDDPRVVPDAVLWCRAAIPSQEESKL